MPGLGRHMPLTPALGGWGQDLGDTLSGWGAGEVRSSCGLLCLSHLLAFTLISDSGFLLRPSEFALHTSLMTSFYTENTHCQGAVFNPLFCLMGSRAERQAEPHHCLYCHCAAPHQRGWWADKVSFSWETPPKARKLPTLANANYLDYLLMNPTSQC